MDEQPPPWSTSERIGLALLALVLLWLTLVLVGCSDARRDRAIADSAATSHQAASAILDGADPAPAAAAIQSQAAATLVAVDIPFAPAGVLTSATDQPPAIPAATAQEWHDRPERAFKASAVQARITAATTASAPPGFWAQAWGWIAGAGGVAALVIVRQFAGGPAADLLWSLIAPRGHRAADSERDALAEAMRTTIATIERLGNRATLGDLKAKNAAALTSVAHDAMKRAIADHQRGQA